MRHPEGATRWPLAGLLALAMGCRGLGPGPYAPLETEIAEQRGAWERAATPEYTYVLRRMCFCLEGNEPYEIHVRNGAVVSVRHRDTGEPPPFDNPDLYPTIDGLFHILEDAIDRDAASIEVTFDPADHYPRTVAIDYLAQVADEELGFAASDFSRGPPH